MESRADRRRNRPDDGLRLRPPGRLAPCGQVYVETNVGNLVAINAQTGEEARKETVRLGDTKLESPATPIAYEGVVYVGISGAEVARGHVNAYDEKTGKLLWRTYLACGPTEEPSGSGSCPKSDLSGERLNEGGAGVWTYPAFDPKDGLLFVTTANPSTAEGIKGDFKWATSVVALKFRTGHIKWGFQLSHHDLWDYDDTTPPVYFEREVKRPEARCCGGHLEVGPPLPVRRGDGQAHHPDAGGTGSDEREGSYPRSGRTEETRRLGNTAYTGRHQAKRSGSPLRQ
jgi:glucose dehydrogenase